MQWQADDDCSGKDVFGRGGFPVKVQKIPCWQGNLVGASDFAAVCCISAVESSKINGLALIFFIFARTRARGQQKGAIPSARQRREEAQWKNGLVSSPPTGIAGSCTFLSTSGQSACRAAFR